VKRFSIFIACALVSAAAVAEDGVTPTTIKIGIMGPFTGNASSYSKAEIVLISVLDNNPLLDPSSEDFRNALFEIGQLYCLEGAEADIAQLRRKRRGVADQDHGQAIGPQQVVEK